MIACCGKEIVMGKHSSLGPIDPQFNGIPAYDILQMYVVQMAAFSGQQGRNTRPVGAIIGGQQAA